MNRRDFVFSGSAGMIMLAMPYKAIPYRAIDINNHDAIRINAIDMIYYFIDNKMKHIYNFNEFTKVELLRLGYFGQYFDTAVFMGKVPRYKIQYGIVQSPLPDLDHTSRKIDILWNEKMSNFSEYVQKDWS